MARVLRLSRAFVLMVLLVACGTRASGAGPSAPSAIPIKVPETYSAPEKSSAGEGLEDICKIDPAACPSLDMDKEAARQFKEPLYAVTTVASASGPEILLTGPLSGAPAVRKLRGYSQATPAPTPPGAIPVKPARDGRAELFDIEAKVHVEVDDIEPARKKINELTRAAGGQLMNEVVQDSPSQRGASLSLRIPSERAHAFLAEMRTVGKVLSSSLETREVSRKIADAEVLQRNLERAISRYEELLAKAANVTEANLIESELSRVRTNLDRVRSDLEWARDRVARSTVYVTLSLEADHVPQNPEAKLHPGIRAALLVDIPPADSQVPTTTFAGGGLSIQWPRTFGIDLDLLKSLREDTGGAVDFWIVTLGTELYSDLLGGGNREFLNPYIGFRTGFAHAPNQSFWPIGGTVGVDIYKSSSVLFAVETRAYTLIARDDGPDFAIEPALGLNVAY